MITLRLIVLSASVLSSVQYSYNNGNEKFLGTVKELVSGLPIPYDFDLNVMCNGPDAQLKFGTSVTIDKDQDLLTGLDPLLDRVNISINLTDFKIPIQGQIICMAGSQIYTFGHLLLLNLTASNLDVTDFINNDIMTALYASFSPGSSGITFNAEWSLNSTTKFPHISTRLDGSPKKEYKMETIFSIINKAVLAILHLPRSLLFKLINKDSMNGINIERKSPMEKGDIDIAVSYFGTKLARKQKDMHSKIKGKLDRLVTNHHGIKYSDGIQHTAPSKIKGKGLKSASVKILNKLKNNLNEKEDGYNRITAIIAASLLSVGITGFISVMIITVILYHKNKRGRTTPKDIESGSNIAHNSRIMPKPARTGPSNIRLSASRTRPRLQSAPVVNYVPDFTNTSQFTVQPQENLCMESQIVNNTEMSPSDIVNGRSSYLLQPPTEKSSLKLSQSSSNLQNVPDTKQRVKCNSDNDSSQYSHIFQGKFLNVMRKVSTSTHLPSPNNTEGIKTKIIHVKPVNTKEQI